MREFSVIFCHDLRRRLKDSFLIGYNIIFPMIMIVLLGYLASGSYGKKFTGYHYYSIVMLPFCIAMAVITAAYAAKEDAYKKTAVRFLFAPVALHHIVAAKLLSCTVVISLCNLIVLTAALLVFRLPIADRMIPLTIMLSAETFMVCAIGLLVGFGMKNFIFVKNLLNIPICLAAILGGSLFPIGTFHLGLRFLLEISPLTWINRGMFLSVYDDNSLLLWRITIILVTIGIVFAVLAARLFKKEEFIHGDLPGYEK